VLLDTPQRVLKVCRDGLARVTDHAQDRLTSSRGISKVGMP
jgi:hypothetical protein